MENANATAAEFLAAREPTGPAPVPLWRVLLGYRVDPLARWTQIRTQHGEVARYRFALADSFLLSSTAAVKQRRTRPGEHHDLLAMFMNARDEQTRQLFLDPHRCVVGIGCRQQGKRDKRRCRKPGQLVDKSCMIDLDAKSRRYWVRQRERKRRVKFSWGGA